MSEHDKIKALAERILGGARDFVVRSLVPVNEAIADLRKQLSELPPPQRGDKGDKGDAGDKGDRGDIGPDGKDGADGRDGMDGKDADPEIIRAEVQRQVDLIPKAIDGKDGQPGADGRDGKSIDHEEVRAFVKAAVAEIPSAKDGEPGTNGANGKDGKDFDPELLATLAEKAVNAMLPGLVGKSMQALAPDLIAKCVALIPKPQDGRDGRDGDPGRDAGHIDILPGIDAAKRYARGTHAAFRGGTVAAFRATDPMPEDGDLEKSGWHVVQNGIAEIAVESSADDRTYGVAVRTTNGQVVVKQFETRALLDRGIFKADSSYVAGDVVTWDGSLWISQRSTLPTERPGDESGAWRLSVKRGRDGRDGLKGEPGTRGAEGRAGKDLQPRSGF